MDFLLRERELAMLILTLLVSQAVAVPVASTTLAIEVNRNERLVGHYIGAVRDLRGDVLYGGQWGWREAPGGCEVVISGTDEQVLWTKDRDRCDEIALRSKVSFVAIELLLEALDRMDRESPSTLTFARQSARELIEPLYPERWSTLRQAEDLFR
jgi:hypothetical protein